jgi:hypothetical protein
VLAFFGEHGAGALAMAIMAEVMVLLSVGAMIMGVARGGDAGTGSLPVRGVLRGVLRGALLNAVVAAIVLSTLVGVLTVPVAAWLMLG